MAADAGPSVQSGAAGEAFPVHVHERVPAEKLCPGDVVAEVGRALRQGTGQQRPLTSRDRQGRRHWSRGSRLGGRGRRDQVFRHVAFLAVGRTDAQEPSQGVDLAQHLDSRVALGGGDDVKILQGLIEKDVRLQDRAIDIPHVHFGGGRLGVLCRYGQRSQPEGQEKEQAFQHGISLQQIAHKEFSHWGGYTQRGDSLGGSLIGNWPKVQVGCL